MLKIFFAAVFSFLLLTMNAVAAEIIAPDSTQPGPYQVASGEYHLPASIDPDVLAGLPTELWAKVFYPKDLNGAAKFPLIVMLHGNHATCGTGSHPRKDWSCEYTNSGTCPAGYVPVPNHEGYNYLAENLASWGYLVVSVNANRSITCGGGEDGDWGLNLARGKLVLKHLSSLYQWSTTGGAPEAIGLSTDGLVGKIDFSKVGLLGHSRGGEGVRAAYNIYRDPGSIWPAKIPGLSVKAIFEIGAVDGQTSRVLDANGTTWNQLLPMCDGDVSDLEGRFPFERMMRNSSELPDAQKSLYEVWGANHNFYNTEWQSSDSSGCLAGTPLFNTNDSSSERQQKTALASVPAFFRSHLGTPKDATFNQNFNPFINLPTVVTGITQIDRDFTPSPAASQIAVVDDFDREDGISSAGFPNILSQVKMTHQSGPVNNKYSEIVWNAAGPNTFYEGIWAAPGEGRDIHDFATLDFRIARAYSTDNVDASTDFSIQLEDAAGHFSKELRVSNYGYINGPGGNDAAVLKTVRIPVSAFEGIDLTKVHGVKFTFNQTSTGTLYFANIRFHRNLGMGSNAYFAKMSRMLSTVKANEKVPLISVPENLNSIQSIKVLKATPALKQNAPGVEITLTSQVPFTVMDRLPILKIGKQEFKLSRYADMAQLKKITFTLTTAQYKQLQKKGEVTIINGKLWKFGKLESWLGRN